MMKLPPAKALRALLLLLPLFGAASLSTASFAYADEPPVAVTSADAVLATPESTPSELDEFAQREDAAKLDEFQAGDQVIITTSGVLLVLVVVLILVILL